jgi:D-aminopeptidase
MLGSPNRDARYFEALERIATQTRARFKLAQEEVVMVAQVACALPGCPPLETVVVFWTAAGVRHRFKIFKPVVEVTQEDLPWQWLMRALAAPDSFDTDCC